MTEQNAEKMESARGASVAFFLSLAIAAAFFAFHSGTIERISLTTDEIEILNHVRNSGAFESSIEYYSKHQGMLYNLAALGSTKLFPQDNLAVRFPALIFAALCFPALFALARRFVSPGVAAASVLFMAVSPSMAVIATDGRGYSLFLLCCILLCIVAIKIANNHSIANKILLFAIAAAAADMSMFAIAVAPVGLLIVFYSINKKEDHFSAFRNGLGYILYTSAAFLTVQLLYSGSFGYIDVFPPPTLASSTGYGFWNWLAYVFVGAYSGLNKHNASLAVAAAPLCVYGAVLLRRHSAVSFKTLFPASFAVLLITALYYSSGAHPVPYRGYIRQAGFALALALPFISVFIAAAYAYFLKATFSRRALDIYTPMILVRVIVTIAFMLFGTLLFVIGIAQNGRDASYLERENWSALKIFLKSNSRKGDVIYVNWKDSLAADYHLSSFEKPIPDITEPYHSGKEPDNNFQTFSWILALKPPIAFEHENDPPSIARLGTNAYNGAFGTLKLTGGQFAIISGRTPIRVATTMNRFERAISEKGDVSHVVYCAPTKVCSFNIVFMEEGEYEISLPPEALKKDRVAAASICGKPLSEYKKELSDAVLSGRFKAGLCNVTLPSTSDLTHTFDIIVRSSKPTGDGIFYPARINRDVE